MMAHKKTNSLGRFESMWTPKRRKKALELYVTRKWPLRKVAEYFECSLGAVQNLMVVEDVIRKRNVVFTKEQENLIRRLFLIKNVPIAKIHKRVGVSELTLVNFIRSKKWKRDDTPVREKARQRSITKTVTRLVNMQPSSYPEYKDCARKLVWPMWRRYHETIDPNAFRLLKNYHIDHKISLYKGFHRKSRIPLHIIAHPANLRTISALKNAHKGAKSCIKLAKLKADIVEFEATYGKVFDNEN